MARMKVDDPTGFSEEYKAEKLNKYVEASGKMGVALFKHLRLKTHIEATVIDQDTGEKYLFRLIKIDS